MKYGNEEIIEYNKLIAEFMTNDYRDKRLKTYPLPYTVIEVVPSETIIGYGSVSEGEKKHNYGTPDMMLYHKDWRWIMGVFDRIEKLNSLKYNNQYFSTSSCFIQEKKKNYNLENYDYENLPTPYIYSKKYSFCINLTSEYSINKGLVASGTSTKKILAAFECVVNFIKYYNNESTRKS